MSKKCKTSFILKEFYEYKSIKWNLYVDSTPGPHCYDMILGCNIKSELRIMLYFKDQTMTWDDSTINMKDPESLPELLDPVNDFFWNNNQYMRQRCFKKLLPISRKFLMQSTHQQTSMKLYGHVDISPKMKNFNCMPYCANMNICLMAPWGHGKMNLIILNLKKGLNLTIAGPFLFQKFRSTL